MIQIIWFLKNRLIRIVISHSYILLCSQQGIYMNRLGGLIREAYLNFLFFKCFYCVLMNFYLLNYLNTDLTWLLLVFCRWHMLGTLCPKTRRRDDLSIPIDMYRKMIFIFLSRELNSLQISGIYITNLWFSMRLESLNPSTNGCLVWWTKKLDTW